MRASFRLNPASLFARILFTAVTLGLLVGAVASGWDNVRFRGAPTTTGVVVEHEYAPIADRYGGTSDGWKLVVEWTDEDGETWRTPTSFATSDPREIGSEVPVQYVPGDQGMVRIATWSDKWGMSALIGGFALLFAGFTAYTYVSAHRARQSHEQVAADPYWDDPADG